VRIEENTFLVAGGGSGLGEATARMLAASGARVVVADLKGEPPEGGRFVETDVTDEGSVRAAVNAALEVGGLRGAVNCAGVASAEKVLGREGPHSLDSFAKVVQINLIGTFNVIRLAAEAMVSSAPSESAALSSTRPAWPHSTARSGR
jgi:NAD(P)-dependent dehydrogenase (short-subunit alcohol dehydrogenase family)